VVNGFYDFGTVLRLCGYLHIKPETFYYPLEYVRNFFAITRVHPEEIKKPLKPRECRDKFTLAQLCYNPA